MVLLFGRNTDMSDGGWPFSAWSILFPVIVRWRSFIRESMNAKKQKALFKTRLGNNYARAFLELIKERLFGA